MVVVVEARGEEVGEETERLEELRGEDREEEEEEEVRWLIMLPTERFDGRLVQYMSSKEIEESDESDDGVW